jgi:hypothetical protein
VTSGSSTAPPELALDALGLDVKKAGSERIR